jgi:lauroyl/myristoyl acyltransferase
VILGAIFEAMDDRGIRFDPLIFVSGLDVVHETLREQRGVLLIGTHSNGGLMRAVLRPLYDAGVPATPIAITAQYPICGAGLAIPAIRPLPAFMLRVLTLLRDGHVVCGMLDAFQQSPQRTLELRAGGGSIWVNDSLIRLAFACKAKIVFAAARLDRNSHLSITLRAASELQSPDDCRREFISFFEQHMT